MTTPRKWFGHSVSNLREQMKLTQAGLARIALTSQSQISAVERGDKGASPDLVERLDSALNAGGSLLRRWEDTEKAGRWWASWFTSVASVERESTEVFNYQPLVVPCLLQTPSYARAIISQGRPDDSEEELEQRVRARMDRASILDSNRRPMLRAIIEETVLKRPVGGHDVISEQVEHLRKLAEHPRVRMGIVEADNVLHPGADGSFSIFVTPSGKLSFTETATSGTPSDDPAVIDHYIRVWSELSLIAVPAARWLKEESGS